jgi:hypothetical protein
MDRTFDVEVLDTDNVGTTKDTQISYTQFPGHPFANELFEDGSELIYGSRT